MSYDEDHALAVMSHLEAAGREVLRIDLADFPVRGAINLEYPAVGWPELTLTTPAIHAEVDRCHVAWWRRVRPFTCDPKLGTPLDHHFAVSETGQALHGLFQAMDCTWVNPPLLDGMAQHKPYQWEAARRVGLTLPRTLVTNQPERAQRFVDEIGIGRTVFKSFLATAEAWRETRVVRLQDLAHLEAVRYAPVIFQEFVVGVDLRVTIVGERVFAAEIDATDTSYPVDMRMVIGESKVRPVTLPAALTATLLRLMRHLGLVYGAVDLRRRPDGQYVFFEVNPAGQWLFAEEHAGLPITSAVAGLLSRLDDLGSQRTGAVGATGVAERTAPRPASPVAGL
ncbi:MvdC/MvdD family ATP grasp protein [Streptomyces sp. NPDC002835]